MKRTVQELADSMVARFLPPSNVEAEMAVLGSMVLSRQAVREVRHIIPTDGCFVMPAHRAVYRAILGLADERKEVDLVTLKDRLSVQDGGLDDIGGVEYLIKIAESVPSATNARHYAQIVVDKWREREVSARCLSVVEMIGKGQRDDALQLAGMVAHGLTSESTVQYDAGDVLASLTDHVEPGVESGFRTFDMESGVGGWYRGEPNYVAGHTGRGKSLILTTTTVHACRKGHAVRAVTLEMPAKALMRRIMRHLTGFWSRHQAETAHSGHVWTDAEEEIQTTWDLVLYDTSARPTMSARVEQVCEWIEWQHSLSAVDLWTVDYVQLLKTAERFSKRNEELDYIQARLRETNIRLGNAMVVASQMSEYDGRSSLAGSSEMEKGAAAVLELTTEKMGRAKDAPEYDVIACRKLRHGKGRWAVRYKIDDKTLLLEEVHDERPDDTVWRGGD